MLEIQYVPRVLGLDDHPGCHGDGGSGTKKRSLVVGLHQALYRCLVPGLEEGRVIFDCGLCWPLRLGFGFGLGGLEDLFAFSSGAVYCAVLHYRYSTT